MLTAMEFCLFGFGLGGLFKNWGCFPKKIFESMIFVAAFDFSPEIFFLAHDFTFVLMKRRDVQYRHIEWNHIGCQQEANLSMQLGLLLELPGPRCLQRNMMFKVTKSSSIKEFVEHRPLKQLPMLWHRPTRTNNGTHHHLLQPLLGLLQVRS